MVCFDDAEYRKSGPCMQELSWCGRNKQGEYICVGGLMSESGQTIADEISRRAEEKGVSSCSVM